MRTPPHRHVPHLCPCRVRRGRRPAAQEESQRTAPPHHHAERGEASPGRVGPAWGHSRGWRRGGPVPGQEGRPECRLEAVSPRAPPGEEAVKFAVSGFGKHRVRVSRAAGGGEGQAQLISCQSGPEAPASLRAGHRGGDAGNGSHSSGGGPRRTSGGPRGVRRWTC